MKRFSLYIIFIITALAFCQGCVKNEFALTASLPQSVNSTYKVSYYANDKRGGMEIEAALNVQRGEGALPCMTRNPSLGWIFYRNSPMPAAIFFAERGDKLKITGEDENPFTWQISGNKVNELLSEWRMANKELLQKQAENYRLNRPDKGLAAKINKAVTEFAVNNPKSPASVILLGVYFDSAEDPAGERKIMQMLIDSEVLDKYSYLITRQDRDYSVIPETPDNKLKPQQMIIQSYHTGCDTIHLGDGRSDVVMMFTKISAPQRKEMLDSIKSITRLRKDSLGLLLVDMSVGVEESQWRYTVRRDSLKGVLQGLAVRGLADDNLRKLGVSELPQWMVIDKGGAVRYKGSSNATAMKEVRKLLKSAK